MQKYFKFCLNRVYFLAAFLLFSTTAYAHPMGNFSINHYARFEAKSNNLNLRYIVDYAEIPTSERASQLDSDGNGAVSEAEKTAFLNSEANSLAKGLTVSLDGQKTALQTVDSKLDLIQGAAGLNTLRVLINFQIALPQSAKHRVEYRDGNFAGRTGWMEIIAAPSADFSIRDSDAAQTDRSRELTRFPADSNSVPPRQTAASFTLVKAGVGVTSNKPDAPLTNSPAAPDSSAASNTPHNGFTQAIAERDLTPGVMLLGVLIALAFGAVHALSPGHGKTMVAAYLVGSRGTPRHAILLGAVVTITHTFGVFLLGIITLFATRYIVPEKLYPALSGASGMIIFGVGLWLLMDRWQLLNGHGHHQGHAHDHTHAHDHAHDHSHAHDHTHSHESDYEEHLDEHGTLVHSHGGKAHSHTVPDGPVTAKTLILLGISGGIVPCPEALVVLLAAIKMNRILYGLLLIVGFSIGLAAALIAIGLIVVSARQKLSKLDNLGSSGKLVRYLPVGSAAVITIIGAMMTLSAMGTGTP